MKCWKCGNDLPENVSACTGCGASMNRPATVSVQGSAMRQIFDRFGGAVFTKKSMLPIALGDLLEDSKKLRNQLDTVLAAGVGNLYLEQIQNAGKPDDAFRARVKTMMVDEADLSEKAAVELMGYIDEMIGWAAPAGGAAAQSRPTTGQTTPTNEIPRPTPGQTTPRPTPTNEIPRPTPGQDASRPTPTNEIPRPTPNNEIPRPSPNKEIPRPEPNPAPPRPQPEPAQKKKLLDAPVPSAPVVAGGTVTLVEFAPVLVFVVAIGAMFAAGPVGLLALPIGFWLCANLRGKWDWQNGRTDLKVIVLDGTAQVSWTPVKEASDRYAIAVNGEWVAVVNGNSAEIKLDPSRSSQIVLAEVIGNSVVYRGGKLYQPKN